MIHEMRGQRNRKRFSLNILGKMEVDEPVYLKALEEVISLKFD